MKYFEPLTLPSGERLRNRLVVAAMTNQQSEADGCLHERERVWLEARAKGGFGNVTTCAAHVSLDGQGWTGELGVFDDKHIPGLTHLAETLTHHQASAWVQLFHGGSGTLQSDRLQPWSATAFDLNQTGVEIPRAATEEDIQRTIQNLQQPPNGAKPLDSQVLNCMALMATCCVSLWVEPPTHAQTVGAAR